jgi:hypothetical protein
MILLNGEIAEYRNGEFLLVRAAFPVVFRLRAGREWPATRGESDAIRRVGPGGPASAVQWRSIWVNDNSPLW